MDLAFTLPVALAAALLDVTVGYPLVLYRAVRHPVVWMRFWGQALVGPFSGNAATFALYLAPVAIAPIALVHLAPAGLLRFAAAALLGSTLLSQQALDRRVRAIARALDQGAVEAAREAASGLRGAAVSRDETSIAAAALEALARHFARGVVAPLFWIALGGVPGAAVCKAVEVARGWGFGAGARRLDEFMGAPGDALSTAFLMGAARLQRGAIARRPSSARAPADWPSAALLRALGLDAPANPDRTDLRRGLALYRRAAALEIVVMAACALAAHAG